MNTTPEPIVWTSRVSTESGLLMVARRMDFGLRIEQHDRFLGAAHVDLTDYEWRELVAAKGGEVQW